MHDPQPVTGDGASLPGTLPDRHRATAYAGYSREVMFVQVGGSWVMGDLRDATVGWYLFFQGFAGILALVPGTLFRAYVLGALPTGARY